MWKTYGFHILTLKGIIMKLNLSFLKKDSKLEEAIKEKWGIRILNQEFCETLISFIISQK